jgi:hypothetical protein
MSNARGWAWRAAALALWSSACASGVVDFDGGPDQGAGAQGAQGTQGGGGGGEEGGAVTPSCTQDVDCVALADDCNQGTCVEGECATEAANEQFACDDGDPCTTSGSCAAGSCQPGGPIDCSDLDDDCNMGVCDVQQGCIKQAANDGGSCDDGMFCTANDVCNATGTCAGPDPYDCGPPSVCATIACDEAQDVCSETPITACVSGDGCCPINCSLPQDTDCNCNNIALSATASSSGGGNSPCCAVGEMNNTVTEPVCAFHWISNSSTPAGAFIEYQWASPVTVGSIHIATQLASAAVCGASGRNIASGSVQYWDGAGWVTATTFTGQLDDVAVDLPQPVSTTGLRIFDMTTSAGGNGNSMIYEWSVFPLAGCIP